MKYETLTEIREVAEWALRKCGTPELIETLVVEFNGRFTRRAGDANVVKNKVRFSTPLWPRMAEEERWETIVHEACHLAAFKIHFPTRIGTHGRKWEVLMLLCGATGERCHKIDRTGLKRKAKRYPVKCDCKTHHVTAKTLEKIKKSDWRSYYYCPRCRGKLRVEETLSEAA